MKWDWAKTCWFLRRVYQLNFFCYVFILFSLILSFFRGGGGGGRGQGWLRHFSPSLSNATKSEYLQQGLFFYCIGKAYLDQHFKNFIRSK